MKNRKNRSFSPIRFNSGVIDSGTTVYHTRLKFISPRSFYYDRKILRIWCIYLDSVRKVLIFHRVGGIDLFCHEFSQNLCTCVCVCGYACVNVFFPFGISLSSPSIFPPSSRTWKPGTNAYIVLGIRPFWND